MRAHTQRNRQIILAISTFLILSLGSAWALYTASISNEVNRKQLLEQTRWLAQSIDKPMLAKLEGKPSDVELPEYTRIKTQLAAARNINPLWEWIYVMGRNPDGSLFFYVHSE